MIKKLNYSRKDIGNFKGWENICNAHYFHLSFLNSSDENRMTKNPSGIKYEQMFNTFGEPNFEDDYNDSKWWILDFNENLFSVDIQEQEGSRICIYLKNNKNIAKDIQINKDIVEFYKELFNII